MLSEDCTVLALQRLARLHLHVLYHLSQVLTAVPKEALELFTVYLVRSLSYLPYEEVKVRAPSCYELTLQVAYLLLTWDGRDEDARPVELQLVPLLEEVTIPSLDVDLA